MKTPTFLLKPSAYKTDKLYAILPTDGNGDFTVASYVGNGTRVNPNGLIEDVATDTPRIDYLDTPGLLIEPSRTNFFTYSEDVSNWTQSTAVVTANNSISPDGTLTADKIYDNDAATALFSRHSKAITTSTAIHTVSLFLKFGNADNIDVIIDTATSAGSFATLTREGGITVTADTASRITSSGSERYNDGWIRFYFVYDMNDADPGIDIYVYPGSSSDVDKLGYCWVWGIQCEEGSFVTSYIPTVATTVTRAYDQLTLTNTVTNGLFGLANGSFFIDYLYDSVVSESQGSIISIGSTNGLIGISSLSSSQAYSYVRAQNTDTTTSSVITTQKRNRVVFILEGDNVDVWVNGTLALTTAKDLFITSETINISGAASKIKILELALFDKNLTATEAQSITQ